MSSYFSNLRNLLYLIQKRARVSVALRAKQLVVVGVVQHRRERNDLRIAVAFVLRDAQGASIHAQ